MNTETNSQEVINFNNKTIRALKNILHDEYGAEEDSIQHLIQSIYDLKPDTDNFFTHSPTITIRKESSGLIKIYQNRKIYPPHKTSPKSESPKSTVYEMHNINPITNSPKKILKKTKKPEVEKANLIKFFTQANDEGWGCYPIWLSASGKNQVILKEKEIRQFIINTISAQPEPEQAVDLISRLISQIQRIAINVSINGLIMNDIKMDNFVVNHDKQPIKLQTIDCGSISEQGTKGVECTHLPPFFKSAQIKKIKGDPSFSLVVSDFNLFCYGYVGTILEVLYVLQRQIQKIKNNTISMTKWQSIASYLPWNKDKITEREKRIEDQKTIEDIILSTARVVKDIGCLFLDPALDMSELTPNKWEFFTFVNEQIAGHLSLIEFKKMTNEENKTENIKPITGRGAKENIEAAMEFFPRKNEKGIPAETTEEASNRALQSYKAYLSTLRQEEEKTNAYNKNSKCIKPQKITTESTTHGSPA